MSYAVVIERTASNSSAFVAAESQAEVVELIREAVDFHLEGMREADEEMPQPTT